MEIFLLIIIFFILLSIRSLIANKNKQLNNELIKLRAELLLIKNQIANLTWPVQKETTEKPTDKATEKQESTSENTVQEPIIVKQNFTPPKPMHIVDVKEEEATSFTSITNSTNAATPIEEPVPIADINKPIEEPTLFTSPKNSNKKKSFFENNPDLEKFIGENLVNKIGIAILVLGIGYFVKFAIDKNWINEIGRVAIGLLCGGILIGLAHRLRKEFSAFSSVLVGGGIAVLYFTISLAFHDYHLFSQTLAFAMMVVITAFAVLLAIAYDRIELAVLAIIGGFGSPFFVSTGQGNHVVLFTYLLVLNLGMLSLAYYKKWNLVNIICYAFTVLIFGGWLLSKFDHHVHHPVIVLLFALAFYVVFFAMNIVYNLKNNLPFQALEISILLSNTFLFFSTGLYLLNSHNLSDFKGMFTIVMGLFNLGFAYPLYKRGNTDKNLIFMLIGLVLTFVSLAAPIQLKGHYITLFWAAETVLLLWLSQKSGIKLIKQTSILLAGLLLISLFIDWSKFYGNSGYHLPFANKAFVTGIFCVVALFVKLRLLKFENNNSFHISFMPLRAYQITIQSLIVMVLYLVLYLEIEHQILYFYNSGLIRNIVLVCYHFSYVLLLLQLFKKHQHAAINQIKIALLAISILLLFLCNQNIIDVRNDILKFNANIKLFFYLHFYLFIVVFYFINALHQAVKVEFINQENKLRYFYWTTTILLIITASIELDHLVVYSMFNPHNNIHYLLTQNHKFGYAILWGAFAFVLINVGMRRKIREIRIISLALFTLVILKLFLYDINNISEAGRIIAFVLLGVLLLVVSFMYQRLKKLLTSDTEVSATENNNENEM
jgi:uncharacterized membrane protein